MTVKLLIVMLLTGNEFEDGLVDVWLEPGVFAEFLLLEFLPGA